MTSAEPGLVATTSAQHRALGHPMRHRLLNALRDNPATISQLARRLNVHKGGVAHHLSVLVEAGLVRPAEERHVRGGTEKYFETAPGPLVAPNDLKSVSALFAAIAPKLAGDDAALLHLRHLRLSQDQAARLRTTLKAILSEPAAGEADQATFGVLVGMYRHG